MKSSGPKGTQASGGPEKTQASSGLGQLLLT